MDNKDEKFMLRALELARLSALEGEVPVGAVVVRGDEIVGEGRNRRETEKNALCHAEITPAETWAAGGCGNAICM